LWSDEDFNEFTNRIEQLNKTEQETLIFQDEQRLAQEQRIKEERQKLKAETDKLWEEMEKIKNDRTQFRNSVLTNLGLAVSSLNNNYWSYFKRKNVFDNVSIILREEVENFSNEEWQNALVSIDTRIEELKRQDQIDEEADKRKILDEQKSEQIDIEEVAEEKLNIFISNLSDKEKFEVYLASLLDITAPEMKTKKYQGFVTGLVKSISSFRNMS
jgi:hypothetical protein